MPSAGGPLFRRPSKDTDPRPAASRAIRCQVRSGGRTRTLGGPSPDRTLLGLGLEVSGFPGLVDGCLLGAVDAEEANQPAPGLVWIHWFSCPAGAVGPKNRSTDSSPAASGKSNRE